MAKVERQVRQVSRRHFGGRGQPKTLRQKGAKRPKREQKRPKREQKGAKGPKREQKGPKREQKGAKRSKREPKGAKREHDWT